MWSIVSELTDLHCWLNIELSGMSWHHSMTDRLTTRTSEAPLTNFPVLLSSSVEQISQNYCEDGGIIGRKVLSKLSSATNLHIRTHHHNNYLQIWEHVYWAMLSKETQFIGWCPCTEWQMPSCFHHSGYLRIKIQKMSLTRLAMLTWRAPFRCKITLNCPSFALWLNPV